MTSPNASDKTTPRRPVLTEPVSVKLSLTEKRALDKIAFDEQSSVARLIRLAVRKTYPGILSDEESEAPWNENGE